MFGLGGFFLTLFFFFWSLSLKKRFEEFTWFYRVFFSFSFEFGSVEGVT